MSRHVFDEDDLAFGQRLLAAGQAESLPNDRTEAALLRFTDSLAALHGSVTEGSGVAGAGSGVGASAWSRIWAMSKWLALGAMGGSVVTFLWVQRAAPPAAAAVPAPSANELRAAVLVNPRLDEPKLDPPARVARTTATNSRRRVSASTIESSAARAAKSTSDLAAEVAALDAIRTNLAIGAWSNAEQQLSRYRRDFPRAALRSEAEVLAIEATVAQGRKPAAAAAAAQFIAQHPRDPQVARMRSLTQ